jgi:dTMP kinase
MSLIVMEGLDGSGKGTQSRILYERVRSSGKKIMKVTFPDYDSPSSQLVKMYLRGDFGKEADAVNPYAASAFYAVDRYASFVMKWKKEYDGGTVILADRYTTSNIVFQLSKLPEEAWDPFLQWIEDFEYGKLALPRPDAVIYTDMPVEISQKLLSQRYQGDNTKKDIHESDVSFLERCRKAGLYAAQRLSWQVVRCWEGDRPRQVEEISKEIFEILEQVI